MLTVGNPESEKNTRKRKFNMQRSKPIPKKNIIGVNKNSSAKKILGTYVSRHSTSKQKYLKFLPQSQSVCHRLPITYFF